MTPTQKDRGPPLILSMPNLTVNRRPSTQLVCPAAWGNLHVASRTQPQKWNKYAPCALQALKKELRMVLDPDGLGSTGCP